MKYETYLKKQNLSNNTIKNYCWTANYFNKNYSEINKTNLLDFKDKLIQTKKTKYC